MNGKELNALTDNDLAMVSGGVVVEVSVIQGHSYKYRKNPKKGWYQPRWEVLRGDGKIMTCCWTEKGAKGEVMDLTRDNFLHQDERFEKYNEMVRRDIIT